ncbi:MAG TPA: lasso peptide biosynthesis B2 protein [Acidobacteriota bacterium]|jgi:hypothetical protein
MRSKLETRNPELETYCPHSAQQAKSNRVVWAIDLAGKYVPATKTCLIRALAAHALLNQRGYRTQLFIGVTKDGIGHLQAHAWVENNGKIVIGESGVERFTPLQYAN